MSNTPPNTRRVKVTVNEVADRTMSPTEMQQLMKTAQEPPKPIAESKKELTVADLQKEFDKSRQSGKNVSIDSLPPEILQQLTQNAEATPEAEPIKKPTKVITNNVDQYKAITNIKFEESEGNSKSFEPRIKSEVSKDLGEHAVRMVVCSNCIFYPFEDFSIRPFGTPDLFKIWDGSYNKREDLLIDVINDCVSIDLWDLTEKDFRHTLFWLRLNSYTRNPYDLTWVSMYGNQNKLTITNSTLTLKELDASREEYQQWLDRGFKMPTMRDLTEYKNMYDELTPQERYAWVRGKYLQGDSVKEKLANISKMSPDEYFIDTREFVRLFENYGVKESAVVRDKHFKADEAILNLEKFNNQNKFVLVNENLEGEALANMLRKITDIEDEIARINNILASNSGEAAPISETVTFNISVTDFFPTFF